VTTIKLSKVQESLLFEAAEATPGDGVRVHGAGMHRTARVLRDLGLARGEIRLHATDEGKALVASWRCARCGHADYHCPASGCNHVGGDGEWCDCEQFEAQG